MDLRECYLTAGGNYEDVMRRLMREDRVDRFLKMFLEDQSFNSLCGAIGEGDYTTAFRMAHTVKGISMNLSFTDLQTASAELTENLRGGKEDKDTGRYLEAMRCSYNRTVAAIKAHLK